MSDPLSSKIELNDFMWWTNQMQNTNNSNGSHKLTSSDFFQLFAIGLIGLLIPVVVIYRHFFIVDAVRSMMTIKYGVGVMFIVLAAFISAMNLYLAFVRPWLYQRQHGNLEKYKHDSGAPVIGGIFVVLSALYLPSSYIFGVLLLLVYFVDVGSIPWFFIMLLKHGL
ncbi:MAG: hypothetical protein PHF37_05495 [Phycisphaerae bacterium]|nr:hypothetical protein [Phycisphaerae bacterium]